MAKWCELWISQIIWIVPMQQRHECSWFQDKHRAIIGRPDPLWWDLASLLVFVTDEDDMAPQFEGTTFYRARVAAGAPIVSPLRATASWQLAWYPFSGNHQWCVCVCVCACACACACACVCVCVMCLKYWIIILIIIIISLGQILLSYSVDYSSLSYSGGHPSMLIRLAFVRHFRDC